MILLRSLLLALMMLPIFAFSDDGSGDRGGGNLTKVRAGSMEPVADISFNGNALSLNQMFTEKHKSKAILQRYMKELFERLEKDTKSPLMVLKKISLEKWIQDIGNSDYVIDSMFFLCKDFYNSSMGLTYGYPMDFGTDRVPGARITMCYKSFEKDLVTISEFVGIMIHEHSQHFNFLDDDHAIARAVRDDCRRNFDADPELHGSDEAEKGSSRTEETVDWTLF